MARPPGVKLLPPWCWAPLPGPPALSVQSVHPASLILQIQANDSSMTSHIHDCYNLLPTSAHSHQGAPVLSPASVPKIQMSPDPIFHSTCPLSEKPSSSVYPAEERGVGQGACRCQETGGRRQWEHRLVFGNRKSQTCSSPAPGPGEVTPPSCLLVLIGVTGVNAMLAQSMGQELLGLRWCIRQVPTPPFLIKNH